MQNLHQFNNIHKFKVCKTLIFGAFLLFGSVNCAVFAQNSSDKDALRLKTVVIDAGHGGKDAGAISKDRKTYEKNLTLAIAKAFGKKIEDAYPDVKVIYTRTTDVFVELAERAAIANRNKADLFVSVHINSNDSASPSGFSAHILGQSSQANRDLFSANLELSKRENSVILLEEDYDTKYQGYDPQDSESLIFFNLMQNAYYEQSILFAADVVGALGGGPIKKDRGISQNPFLVLWKTTMPAVLLELGFISNADDLSVLNSTSGREQIAERLLTAFRKFKTEYDGSLNYTRSVGVGDSTKEITADASVYTNTGPADSTSETTATESVENEADNGVKSTDGSGSRRTRTRRSSNGALLFPGSNEPTLYGVQIMSLSRRLETGDAALKGQEVQVFANGELFRYVIVVGENENAIRKVLRSVRTDFPDAYGVKIEDGIPSKL